MVLSSEHACPIKFQVYLRFIFNMPKGGCACGNVRVEWDSEPSAKVCVSFAQSGPKPI